MRVAAIQFCASADWQQNLQQLAPLLAEAGNADVILLPENFACYGGDYRQLAEHSTSIIRWLEQQAKQLGSWLVAGSLPLITRPDGSEVPAPRVRASQLVISPEGSVTARYDKLHLFDAKVDDAQGNYHESAVFEPGDDMVVTPLAGINCGLAICFDLRFATQALWLAQQGAKLLLYPSAFTAVTGAAHWQLLLRARAVETGSYVLAANQCGQHSQRRQSYGHSMLVDPWGKVHASLGSSPGVLQAQIDFSRLDQVRDKLPMLQLQRLGVSSDHAGFKKYF